jgi:S1-C subfamily serine protease
VTAVWKNGSQKIPVPQSGIIVLPINKARLDGLRLVAPAKYTVLKQMNFSEGPAFQPLTTDDIGVPVVDDGRVKMSLQGRLAEIGREGKATSVAVLQEQLSRRHHTMKLPSPPTQPMTPEEIYRRCRPSVVVMGTLMKSGQLLVAGGFVLDAEGILVTNYHVINKQAAQVAAIGAMTADGKVLPVQEVLAADRSTDIAIIRIPAKGLIAAALSAGEPPGAPVTVIAHPAGRFYYLTHGHVSRYSAWINYGRPMVGMSITAEFCPGSSGSPVFSATGAVAGIVSSVHGLGEGMIDKQCMPVQAIRALIRSEPPSASQK